MKTLFLLLIILRSGAQLTKNAVNIGLYLTVEDREELQPVLNNKIARSIGKPNDVEISFHIQTVQGDDIFKSSKVFCGMLDDNPQIVAIFSSELESSSPMIQSICAKLGLPYIQTSWTRHGSYLGRENSLNFYPDHGMLSVGLAKIVESLQWTSFTVLYEDFEGFLRLQDVMKLQKMDDKNQRNHIIVKRLDFDKDIRSTMKEIKQSGEKRIILDCRTEHTLEILRQGSEVGIMSFAYSYFLSSLDAHILDLNTLHVDANITTVRMINPEDEGFKKVVQEWSLSPYRVKTETMLIDESMTLLIEALNDIHCNKNITSNGISCKSDEKYEYGYNIISYMNSHYTSPGAPNSKFDERGRRTDFTLYLIEGNREKIIATWNSLNPNVVNFNRTAEESYKKRVETLQTRIQNISSRLEDPYLMLKKDHEVRIGNDKYEGYIFDLISRIADKLNFQFRIHIVEGNGIYKEISQSWDGIIGEILNEKAQFGIGDMTITPNREGVVDFSMPFMRLGIGILLQKPKTAVSMFAFLNPFSAEVWMYTVTLYLTVSVILYFVARMAPGDWENPHPCNLNPDELENLWSINNCMWLTMGSIMNQGSDILPKGISSRLVTSMWWFFALIMTNSYIASLAAFLTVKGSVIDDLEDLAKQNRIKYGTLDGGSTQEFFEQSNYSTYRRMYANMILNLPSVFAKTTDEGVQRVKNTPDGSYAFLMESTTIDYLVERNCELTTVVDKWFNNIEYGIAMPLDSPYRTAINDAILELQEEGQLTELKNKWWRVMYEKPGTCVTLHEGSELRLKNVGGIFVVLAIGVAIALLLGMIEFFWTVRQTSIEEHVSYWQAFKIEMLFALKVWISKKKIKKETDTSNHFSKSESYRPSEWPLEQSEERQTG